MRRGRAPGRLRADRGSVTAELALTLPAVLAVFALGAAGLVVGARAVVLTDAASAAARAAARGDEVALPPSAPPGSRIDLSTSGPFTCATVSVAAEFGPLRVPITARSCALGSGA